MVVIGVLRICERIKLVSFGQAIPLESGMGSGRVDRGKHGFVCRGSGNESDTGCQRRCACREGGSETLTLGVPFHQRTLQQTANRDHTMYPQLLETQNSSRATPVTPAERSYCCTMHMVGNSGGRAIEAAETTV